MLATNMIVNMNPNVNAQVWLYCGSQNALTRNPIMLVMKKALLSGAIFAIFISLFLLFIYFS